MKHVKDGIGTSGMKPPIVDALIRVALVYHTYGYTFVLTDAGTPGVHKTGSLHYRGYAIDCRTRDVPGWQLPHLLDALQHELGFSYDVIQEKDHFHIEYDPHHDGGKDLP